MRLTVGQAWFSRLTCVSSGQSPSGTVLYLEKSLLGEPALLEGTSASAELRPRGWEIGEIPVLSVTPLPAGCAPSVSGIDLPRGCLGAMPWVHWEP